MERYEVLRKVGGGIFVFALCAALGLRVLYRGLRGDTLDSSGTPVAGRAWFIIGGILLLLPFVGYMVFIWRQGYFANYY